MANSDVKLKHKVQLRKKVGEHDLTVVDEDRNTYNTHTPTHTKSKKWIGILLGVIIVCVVCVIAYFYISKSGDKTETVPEQDIETVVAPNETTDSLTDTDEATAVVSPDNKGGAVNEADNQDVKESETPVTPVETTTTSSMSTSTANNSTNISNDVEAEAMKVIRGDYGVGQERKDKLGSKYQTIQSRVNELKREGIF